MSKAKILAAALTVLVTAVALGMLYHWATRDTAARADEKDKAAPKDKGDAASDEAAVRKTAEAFAKAFDKGDAKAVAALWTAEGEFVGADGEPLRGRKEIEKGYAEFFEKNPKAKMEVSITSLKLLGKHTALEEGTAKVKLPGEKESGVSRYSVLHVRTDDGWKMASVREWLPDPAELVTLKDVEWLIGEWSSKSKDVEVSVSYAWDEDKTSIRGKYSVKRDGKVVSSGTQIIRKDPAGGLRSWQFDTNGTNAESAWTREDNNWVIEAAGTLPDGSEMTATNLLVPGGKDGFTWQSMDRSAAGSGLPNIPPVKVTRVKDKK